MNVWPQNSWTLIFKSDNLTLILHSKDLMVKKRVFTFTFITPESTQQMLLKR